MSVIYTAKEHLSSCVCENIALHLLNLTRVASSLEANRMANRYSPDRSEFTAARGRLRTPRRLQTQKAQKVIAQLETSLG